MPLGLKRPPGRDSSQMSHRTRKATEHSNVVRQHHHAWHNNHKLDIDII